MYALGQYLQAHGVRIAWNGYQAVFQGSYMFVSISGRMIVSHGGVTAVADDPGFLWREKARGWLMEKLAEYLNPGLPLTALRRS
jgi:hypothetical protein